MLEQQSKERDNMHNSLHRAKQEVTTKFCILYGTKTAIKKTILRPNASRHCGPAILEALFGL